MSDLMSPAPQRVVQTLAQELRSNKLLSALSQQRLDALTKIIGDDGYLNYAQAYAVIFPESADGKAQKTRADKAFKKFRDTLAAVAAEHGLGLVLKVDQQRNAPADQRSFWFEAPDRAEQRLEPFNLGETQGLTVHPQEQTLTVRDNKLSYLWVYAEEERKDAEQLHTALATQFSTHDLHWKSLNWHDIPLGENLKLTRQTYLQQARFVLFLLSPALIRGLKQSDEFKHGGPLIGIAMKTVNKDQLLDTALTGVEIGVDREGKAWSKRAGNGRNDWEEQIARRIVDAVTPRTVEQTRELFTSLCGLEAYQRGDCRPGNFISPLLRQDQTPERLPALKFLIEWLRDPVGSVLCAILGELGMGKTTLTQRLTRELLALRVDEPKLPFPVYLDLRHVNSMDWDWTRGAPSLDAMLTHIFEHAYNLPVDTPRPGVDDVKRLAQQHNGLVIFDGLDEVMNRLTPDQCTLFIQSLWSVLPPVLWKSIGRHHESSNERPAECGRLLVTCRSHFFQTLQDQLNALSGRQREVVSREDYLWVTLLPFSGEQVEAYFTQVFSDDPDQALRVIEMLDQVHNLRELSSRPYNLKLIQDQLEQIEAIHREGGQVGVAELYEGMVEQWTQRDSPKHRLKKEHKLLLMERLALRLWRSGEKSLVYTDLEDWLLDELAAEPRWQLNYRAYLNRENGLDILQEDLRNASFLVRQGEDRFRFAHSSIMEFFLARALHRALVEGRPEVWALPSISPETLDFLGGLIAGRQTDSCLQSMAVLRAGYREQTSELILSYTLRALEKSYPGAVFDGFRLPGAMLRGLRVEMRDSRVSSWRNVDLRGAHLDGCRFKGVDLSGACLDDADLARGLFDDCRLDRVTARGADLSGTVFHRCLAPSTDFSEATLYRSQWLGGGGYPVPDSLDSQPSTLLVDGEKQRPPDAEAISVAGHIVTGVAIHPSGDWFVSGSFDHTLKIWEPITGECLQTLSGHSGDVTCVAVDPLGRWVVSGAKDGVLCLWDSTSWKCLRRSSKQLGGILSVACHPEGRWAAYGTQKGVCKLWDPISGEEMLAFEGHQGPVTSVVVDPKGRWLASCSNDGTVRAWDPASGECKNVLQGQEGEFRKVAVHPRGDWLALGSKDGSIRLWDPERGEVIDTLTGSGYQLGTLSVDPRGHWIASSTSGAFGANVFSIYVWDLSSGECLQKIKGPNGGVDALACHPNGASLVGCCPPQSLGVWDVSSGSCLRTMGDYAEEMGALAPRPHGQELFLGSFSGSVRTLDATSLVRLRSFATARNGISCLAADPKGAWLASSNQFFDSRIWNLKTGKLLMTLKTPWVVGVPRWTRGLGGAEAVAADPKGRWLVTGVHMGGILRTWDAESGRCLHSINAEFSAASFEGTSALAVHPDGVWVAFGTGGGSVRLWNPTQARRLVVLGNHKGSVTSVAVDSTGQRLVSSSLGGEVKMWDTLNGDCLWTIHCESTWVTSLAIHPSQDWGFSGYQDGTIRAWSPKSGAYLGSIEELPGEIRQLIINPEGSWMVAVVGRWVLRWDLPTSPESRPDLANPSLGYESLPEDNWVTWSRPLSNQRRWLHWSTDAWRWLGWTAADSGGKGMTRYPMEYFADLEKQ